MHVVLEFNVRSGSKQEKRNAVSPYGIIITNRRVTEISFLILTARTAAFSSLFDRDHFKRSCLLLSRKDTSGSTRQGVPYSDRRTSP